MLRGGGGGYRVRPDRGHVPDHLQRVKDIAVQHLGAIGPFESFDIGVLCWLVWLDVIEGNALGLDALGQSVGNEFRSALSMRMDSDAPRTSTNSVNAIRRLNAHGNQFSLDVIFVWSPGHSRPFLEITRILAVQGLRSLWKEIN